MQNKGIARISSINAGIVRTKAPIIKLSNPPQSKRIDMARIQETHNERIDTHEEG